MRYCVLCQTTILPRQGVIISADEAGSGPPHARYAHPACAVRAGVAEQVPQAEPR